MATPAEFALPAAKYIAGPIFNAIRGAKKRQKLRNAYAEAAFKVRSYYEQDRGIWFDGPSEPKWQAISSILKDEEFAQALSLGAAPREEDIRLLRRKYGQEDPPLLEIVREMTLAIAEIARETLPDDDSTVAGIVMSLDAVRTAVENQRYQRILDEFGQVHSGIESVHDEVRGLRDYLENDSSPGSSALVRVIPLDDDYRVERAEYEELVQRLSTSQIAGVMGIGGGGGFGGHNGV